MATILIKKYQNRRLYNTDTSEYINFADIKNIIKCGDEVKVVDITTNRDITKSILMQAIFEDTEICDAVPIAFLFMIIKTSHNDFRNMFSEHILNSTKLFQENLERFGSTYQNLFDDNHFITDVTQKMFDMQYKTFDQTLKMWFNPGVFGNQANEPESEDDNGTT